MKIKAVIYTVLLFTCLFGLRSAYAQSSDDSAVWSVIESAWQAERRGDTNWIEDALAADFVGWSNSSPAPRDKGSTRLWNKFTTKQVDMLEHELYPLSIIVHGVAAAGRGS